MVDVDGPQRRGGNGRWVDGHMECGCRSCVIDVQICYDTVQTKPKTKSFLMSNWLLFAKAVCSNDNVIRERRSRVTRD